MRRICRADIIAISVVALLAAALVPILIRLSRRNAEPQACANNLRQLYSAVYLYMNKFGLRATPGHTGKTLWEAMTKINPPLIEPDAFRCPMRSRETIVPIQYFGPPTLMSKLGDADPVGCDERDNHYPYHSGNVLRKSGAVTLLEEEEWDDFIASGQCIP